MTSLSLQQMSSIVAGGGRRDAHGPAAVGAEQIHRAVVDLELPVPGAAGAGDAAPLGDVLDLGEHLVHHQLVQEGALLPCLGLQLVHRLLQALQGGEHRPLLPHIAAVQPGGGAGEGQHLLVEESVGRAGDAVILAAEQAGHGEAHPVAHHLHPQGGFAAGAGQLVGGCRQLEDASLHRDALPAGRAEIGQGALGLLNHEKPPKISRRMLFLL